MNVAEKMAKRLSDQIQMLRQAEQLNKQRELFFSQVERVRKNVIDLLERTRLASKDDIDRLGKKFDAVLIHRTQSQHPDAVYWPGTEHPFRSLIAEADLFAESLYDAKVPWQLNLKDFLCRNWLPLVALSVAIISLMATVCRGK